MAEDARPPDLRVLLVGLLTLASEKWPGTVDPSDAARVLAAEDVMLVAARVACQVARRAGVSQEEVAALVAAATVVPPQSAKADFELAPDATVEAVPPVIALMWRIDAALSDPVRRTRIPEWFVDGYYPELLRRLTLGARPLSRDQSILMSVLETAGGVRG